MAYFSPATKEITAKIVYYGPGMCGKTTNLQKVHEVMQPQMKTELLSVATETDRTIYFDFLPVKLGKIAGFEFLVRVFTVPGQPYYAETRRIVLQGADGVVFVADAQRYMLDQNKDSLLDLKKNLRANGLDYNTIPLVLQYNKQDLPDLTAPEDLDAALNDRGVKVFLSSAASGQNVVETLKYSTLSVFKHVREGASRGRTSRPRVKATGAAAKAAPRTSAAAPVRTNTGPIAAAPGARTAALPRAPYATGGERSFPDAGAVPAPGEAAAPLSGTPSTPLGDLVGQVVQGSESGEIPMPSKDQIAHQEFGNLMILHHKLVERVANLEVELGRIRRDYQDMKAILGRKLRE